MYENEDSHPQPSSSARTDILFESFDRNCRAEGINAGLIKEGPIEAHWPKVCSGHHQAVATALDSPLGTAPVGLVEIGERPHPSF